MNRQPSSRNPSRDQRSTPIGKKHSVPRVFSTPNDYLCVPKTPRTPKTNDGFRFKPLYDPELNVDNKHPQFYDYLYSQFKRLQPHEVIPVVMNNIREALKVLIYEKKYYLDKANEFRDILKGKAMKEKKADKMIQELNETQKKASERVAILTSKINILEEMVNQYKNRVCNFETNQKALIAEKQNVVDEKKRLLEENEKLRSQLRGQSLEHETETAKLIDEIERLKDENLVLRENSGATRLQALDQLRKHEKEITKMKEEAQVRLTEIENNPLHWKDTKKENDDFSRRQDALAKLAKTFPKPTTCDEKVQILRNKLKESNEENAKLTVNLGEVKNSLNTVDEALKKATEELSQKTAECKQWKSQAQQNVSSSTAKKRTLQGDDNERSKRRRNTGNNLNPSAQEIHQHSQPQASMFPVSFLNGYQPQLLGFPMQQQNVQQSQYFHSVDEYRTFVSSLTPDQLQRLQSSQAAGRNIQFYPYPQPSFNSYAAYNSRFGSS